jgi:uncharacterized protein (TIGR00730 family)
MCKHHLRVLSGNAVLAGTRGERGRRTDRYCELGLEPTERLMNVATLPSRTLLVPAPPLVPERKSLTVCIYCGAAVGRQKEFEEQTRAAVRVLVSQGHRIVYGGAKNGLMGVMADEAIRLGGTVIGVIPALLVDKELLHKGLNEIHVVASMHERKKKMSDLAEAFLALPGGAGTFEEILEQWTWTQLGIHAKPCGVLDLNGYFAPLRMMVDRMVEEGFLHERHRASLIFGSTIEDVLLNLQNFHVPLAKY